MAVKMEGASPPVFEQIFRNARFAQGGNALFEGKVAGSPRPQVWKEGILNISKGGVAALQTLKILALPRLILPPLPLPQNWRTAQWRNINCFR